MGSHIPAIVRNDNVIGFQFHPEKSGKADLICYLGLFMISITIFYMPLKLPIAGKNIKADGLPDNKKFVSHVLFLIKGHPLPLNFIT